METHRRPKFSGALCNAGRVFGLELSRQQLTLILLREVLLLYDCVLIHV